MTVPQRRRVRRSEITAASSLLLSAAALVTVALLAQAWQGVAAVIAVAAGVIAARLIHNAMCADRRHHFVERTDLARSYSKLAADQACTNDIFVAAMTKQLNNRDRTIIELDATIGLAEARADVAESRTDQIAARLSAAGGRINELEQQLDSRAADPLDELAPWEGADLETVIDLLGWEQRVIDAYEDQSSVRPRHA